VCEKPIEIDQVEFDCKVLGHFSNFTKLTLCQSVVIQRLVLREIIENAIAMGVYQYAVISKP